MVLKFKRWKSNSRHDNKDYAVVTAIFSFSGAQYLKHDNCLIVGNAALGSYIKSYGAVNYYLMQHIKW